MFNVSTRPFPHFVKDLRKINVLSIYPTKFGLDSHFAIDNVFIVTFTIGKYDLHSFVNGLSHHDSPLLVLNKG